MMGSTARAHDGLDGILPVDETLFTEDMATLRGAACRDCGARMFPTRPCCPGCQSAAIEPVALVRTGHVWTYTVLHVAPPGYTGPVPYALGVVELDDGLRITSTITAPDLDRLRIGDRVHFETTRVGPADEPRITFAFRAADEESTR